MAKKNAGGGMAALMDKVDSGDESGSKSKTPICKIEDDALAHLMVDWAKAYRAHAATETDLKLCKETLLEPLGNLRIETCQRNNKLHASIKASIEEETITFTQKAQCKGMTEKDCGGKLRAIFGDNGFKKYFSIERSISIDCDKLTPAEIDKVATAIQGALPPARIEQSVTVDSMVKPAEALYSDMIFDRVIQEKVLTAQENGMVVLYEPTLKL